MYSYASVLSQQRLSYDFRHLDRTNGLLHNEVTAIAQDNKGFIWIGTVKGLQRYDGLRFRNYNDDRGSRAFQNTLQSISPAGNFLWLTSAPETEQFDCRTNRIIRQVTCGETVADPTAGYEAYTDGEGDQYWIKDLEIYKSDAQHQRRVLYMISPASPLTTSGMARDKGRLWIASPNGLLLADSATKRIYSVEHNEINDPLLHAMKGKSAAGIIMDSRHNTWITSRYNDQLYRYDPGLGKLFIYSLVSIKKAQGDVKSPGVLYNNCVIEDDHGNIWVGTRQAGLLKYNSRQDVFDYVVAAKSKGQEIEYNYNINCIFQDDQENIWVGTDKGINIFNPYRDFFQTIKHQEGDPASLPRNDVLGFIQVGSGDILIATWGGGLTIVDSSLIFKKNISIAGTYENNMVWCLLQKDGGHIWAGCQHGYLHTYDIATGKIVTTHLPVFENSTIRCMKRDADSNVWFGLHNGKIVKWEKRSDQFFACNDEDKQHFSSVRAMFIDNASNFWVSAEGALRLFDPVRRVYTATYSVAVQGIEQYNDTLLLIGTRNDGLYYFNIKNRSFVHSAEMDGLASGSVYAIKKDAATNVWLTTDYYLCKLGPGKASTVYAIDADVINSSFASLQFYPLRDGRWVTATNAEVFLFDPRRLAERNGRVKVTITGLSLFDKPMFIDSLLESAAPVTLSHEQNFITIEFSALSFVTVQQTRLQYRLSGVDNGWVNANGRDFASYTNLSPGSYRFSVRAAGDPEAPVTTLAIVIAAPWYKKWWFICICSVMAVLGIFRVVKERERNVKNRTMEKYKMAEAEMVALRAQMNPHFLFNSLNSINNYILKNDADNAAGYLTKFSRLMRLILDNSRNNWIWLQSELKALQLYIELEAFRFDDSFTYRIDVAADVQTEHVMVPPMIIQPYVENAIWHGLMHRRGSGGHLQVDIARVGPDLCITVKDNGVGREAASRIRGKFSENKKSHGMKITAERLEIMNKVYHMEARVSVTDAGEGGMGETGTIVAILFKYTLKKELIYDGNYSR